MAGVPMNTRSVAGLAAWRRSFFPLGGKNNAVLLGMVCTLALGVMEARAAAPAPKEYEVKAAFLFNLVQFVEWPPQAFPTPKTPIIIGILGNDPFGVILDRTVRGETVENRPIAIHRSRKIENLKDCHLLFISKSEKGRLAQIFSSLAGTHCLTVGETDQFARTGGVVNFRPQGADIRFEINMDAARRGGLTISSKLLRLATVIGSERGREGN